ncbi:hypothetical protein Tsubulata_046913 [Turnera subulata]|uniref:Uncharacterized protein n=1 Tax=Turnera subulata TaxID=218843 RepID=A0A9Q0F005_9ROSI|nr:hypothetical protein Tsubulata_046913 [Turnera subulata]
MVNEEEQESISSNKSKMDAKERERRDDVGDNMGRKRSRKEEGINGATEAVTTEEEVEEFYAILRRIHVAVKYFEEGGGKRWTPSSLEIKVVEEVNAGVDGGTRSGQDLGLDLNADPA